MKIRVVASKSVIVFLKNAIHSAELVGDNFTKYP